MQINKNSFLFLLCYITFISAADNSIDISRIPSHPPSVFLDYAASWAVSDAAAVKFLEINKLCGNSSGINPHAKYLKHLEMQSAKILADKIGAEPEQIYFTSGATAANNIAILGVAYKNPKCHLITSKIEHKSVLNVFRHLEKSGYKVTYLDVDKHGNIDLEQLERSIKQNTKLISIQMFNSEIGTLQNITAIGEIARKHKILFHTDAAQSFCKYDINISRMNIDMLTITGHKVGAPKGIGALFVRDIDKLQPIMFGSGDELFPGTKPTALICAFAEAVKNFKFDKEKVTQNYILLKQKLSKIKGVYINSSNPSHIMSISIEGVLIDDLLERTKEYSFSAGCSCLGTNQSNVIQAIDPEGKLPQTTIRISFSDHVDENSLLKFADEIKSVIEQLRKEKSVTKSCEKEQSNITKRKLDVHLNEIQKFLSNK